MNAPLTQGCSKRAGRRTWQSAPSWASFAGRRVAKPNLGAHAVVLGAGMSGLLAARVLSDFYGTVTVVERDALPATAAQRRGVPQGRHAHALWQRGSQILEQLFPGFLCELVAGGCPVVDDFDFSNANLSLGGHQFVGSGYMPGYGPGDEQYCPSRPFLEGHVRQRLRARPNVSLLDGHEVTALTCTPDQRRITGVEVTPNAGERTQSLAADLVVDATGRGSRTPRFLEQFGYGRPAEEEVVIRLAYSSQVLRIAPETLKEIKVLVGPVPGRPTGMVMFANENSTWMLTLFGLVGREPPTEWDAMLGFMEGFTPDHVMDALRGAQPLGDSARYRTPSSRWRRYDKMRLLPTGLLVFGDAICSFNPIYGQGMTVAAIQAMTLRRCLQRGETDLARRFFGAAAKPIGLAWRLAVGGDLSLPEAEGKRPLSTRLTQKYVRRVQTAAECDRVVASQFIRVTAFLDPPSSLIRPSVIRRVAAANRRHARRAISTRGKSDPSLSHLP
jgi:2-polyprenyl-6-methoxyphenol hydroxylase-like FAD-dependent oxidoreductase